MKVFDILKARELSQKGYNEYIEKELEDINTKIETAAKLGNYCVTIDNLMSEPVQNALKEAGYRVEKECDEWVGMIYRIFWNESRKKKKWGK